MRGYYVDTTQEPGHEYASLSIYFDSRRSIRDSKPNHLLPDRSRYNKMTFGGGRKRWHHMINYSHSGADAPLKTEGAEVRRPAQSATAAHEAFGAGRGDGDDGRLEQLFGAFLSPDEDLRHDMLFRMRQDGIRIDDIIDRVLPSVARLLGERWASDQISFAHVTIGTARLQEAVRVLGWHDKTRHRLAEDAPVILLVIPRPEHHTLGAFVLADQWRRVGYRVDVAIDLNPRQIAEMLRHRRYVMIGITAAGRRTLASARELVDILRLTIAPVAPIFVGGAILDKDLDVLAITGADHTARDAGEALRVCGLAATGFEDPLMVTIGHAGAHDGRR